MIEDQIEIISKSQQKRDSKAFQELAKKLATFNKSKIAQLPLEDSLREEIAKLANMPQNSSYKRQIQYIGKCLKSFELDELLHEIQKIENKDSLQKHSFHKIEQWREKILADPSNIEAFIQLYPETNRQQMRQLVRNVEKEKQKNKPPKSFRLLFALIKEQIL